MSTFTLEPQYLYKLSTMGPRGMNTTRPVPADHNCNMPYRYITVDYLGNCLLCHCDGWLPIPVGKVTDFDSIEEVFASTSAKMLQQDIDDKKYSYCAVNHCGIRKTPVRVKGFELAINIDESCNLQCASCRREPIMHTKGPEFDFKLQCIERIISWLDKFDKPLRIVTSGNGDVLASHIMRPLLQKWKYKQSQTFILFTNGLLLRKQLEKLPILSAIKEFSISIDAASQAVYEDVRRPGKWSVLLNNLEFLKEQNLNHLINFKFIVQRRNYQDLPNLVRLVEQFDCRALVSELQDWGTWAHFRTGNDDAWTQANGIYSDHDVLNPQHPEHKVACDVIRSIRNHPEITLQPMVKQAIR